MFLVGQVMYDCHSLQLARKKLAMSVVDKYWMDVDRVEWMANPKFCKMMFPI